MAMKHLEPLPEDCPPDEAEEISSPLTSPYTAWCEIPRPPAMTPGHKET